MPSGLTSANARASAEKAWRRAVEKYRRDAKARGITWKLPYEVAREIMEEDCAYCGTPPATPLEYRYRKLPDRRNGLDRRDNARVYDRGSVCAACTVCNRAKKEMSEAEFREWLARVAKHNGTGSH
jgi:hypothetical protein